MRIKHILVATDISPASRISYAHAVALARIYDARITLIHVDELADFGFRTSTALLEYMERVATVREEMLARAEATFDEELGYPVEVVELPGHPGTVVTQFARENAVDLVVVTRHGEQATGPFGSTSQRVVMGSSVPVLVVHEPAGYSGDVLDVPEYGRVVSGTDFGQDSTRGLQAACAFARDVRGEVRCVHVWRSPGSSIPLAGDRLPELPEELVMELQARYEERFSAWLVDAGKPGIDHLVVPGHSAAVGLIAAALDWDASVIAVPSHGKRTLEAMLLTGTVLRLLALSPLPVLILPRLWLAAWAARGGG